MSDWLAPEEVEELTAYKRWKPQCEALAAMGIPFRVNRIGRPLVERAAVFKGGDAKKAKRQEPDWSAVGGKAA